MPLSTAERMEFDRRIAQIRQIDPSAVIEKSERSRLDLRRVKAGGVIRFGGKTYRVTKTATYTETNDRFEKRKNYVVTEFVLFCLENGETRYLEWEFDDELEVSLTERKIPNRELGRALTYDDGEIVDLDDIDEIVEKEWELVFHGKTYDYDDDWSALYESSDGRTFCVFLAEFGDDDVGWLTVEAWSEDGKEEGDWEYELYLSLNLSAASIEILSYGG